MMAPKAGEPAQLAGTVRGRPLPDQFHLSCRPEEAPEGYGGRYVLLSIQRRTAGMQV